MDEPMETGSEAEASPSHLSPQEPDKPGSGTKRGRGDREHSSKDGGPHAKKQASGAVLEFRLLCPAARSGSIIGKGGEVIKALRSDTGARIKVLESVDGSQERVVLISSSTVAEGEWAPAQLALFRVHSCIVDVEGDSSSARVEARLLVDKAHMGSIMGRGGTAVADMRKSTGANIKIISDEALKGTPGCERVHIFGDPTAVRAALEAVSAKLKTAQSRPGGNQQTLLITANAGVKAFPRMHSLEPAALDPLGSLRSQASHRGPCLDICYWLLVPETQAGMIIGKGGDVIRRIRADTGASVRVTDHGSGDRVVSIVGAEEEGCMGPAQDALFCCCMCLGNEAQPSLVRMLIPAIQIGAVLGKGGSAIATLRSETGCIIRVAPLDGPIPEGVSVPGLGPKSGTADQGRGDQGRNGVEVLSIEGRHSCVAAAAKAAAQQLKQWQVRVSQKNTHGASPAGGRERYGRRSLAPMPAANMGMHSPGRYSGSAAVNLAQQLGLAPPALTGHSMQSGVDPAILAALSAALQGPLGPLPSQHVGDAGLHHPRGMQRPAASAAWMTATERDGSCSARLTVDALKVGSLLGKRGGNIAQIRQVSGAVVKLAEGRGRGEPRVLEVWGAPDQVQAAQNLVQAFLLVGHQQPGPYER